MLIQAFGMHATTAELLSYCIIDVLDSLSTMFYDVFYYTVMQHLCYNT